MLTVLDTFAGAGGFSLGFALAGFHVLGAIEEDAWAADTFATNHREAQVLVEDIRRVDQKRLRAIMGPHPPTVILGGPPCQGYSLCTKTSGDPKDPRNSLFSQFLRIGKLFRPEYLILENVPNILHARTASRRPVIDIIIDELERAGYCVYCKVLEATHYGIPQIRRRLFVLASRHSLARPFPTPTHAYVSEGRPALLDSGLPPCPTLWEAISDLPVLEAGDGQEIMAYDSPPRHEYQTSLRLGSSHIYNHIAMKHTARMVERFRSMSWGESVSDVALHLRPRKRNSQDFAEKVYDQNNRRMHPGRPCHTIPASFYANFVHPYQHRNFTPREGARIQSFPDWYCFRGKPTVVSHKLLQREGRLSEKHLCQYSQIGNAVPPLLAKALAENLLAQRGPGSAPDAESWTCGGGRVQVKPFT